MLDWRRVIQDPDGFRGALTSRSYSESEASSVLSKIQAVAGDRVKLQQECDALKAERNRLSQSVGDMMKKGQKAEAQQLVSEGKKLGATIEDMERKLDEAEGGFREVLDVIPNWPHETVVKGKSATDNSEVRKWGTPRKFDFTPKDHTELGEKTGLLDFSRAAKISGARFAFLRGDLARLERALINFMIDMHRAKGYEELNPPFLVSSGTMYGIGQLPKFAEDVFKIDGQDKFLIPTAEVPVTSFFSGEIVPEEILPKKFVAFSPCFRSEAGSYGRDTRGLIRQHQFLKVELVKFSPPEQSLEELEGMVSDAEDVLKKLEIPYRTVLLCTGDMGFNSRKTYDIEVWLPGSTTEGQAEGQRGCYREISSCSDCGDFQARRSSIRYKPKGGKGTQLLHTLNGSGLAVGRTLIAVMENYQQADGTIAVPSALKPYMGGVDTIHPLG